MLRFTFFACLIFSAGSYAATSDTRDPLEIMGFKETARDRSLVEQAAALTNSVLGSRSGFRLVGSWQPKPVDVNVSKVVRLYLANPMPHSEDDFHIMIPYNCNCVFVQPEVFKRRLARYSNASPQMLKVDDQEALAFMLLHEVGHIEHGDYGKYEDLKKAHHYNIEPTDQKEIENSADRFAADTLVVASNDTAHYSGWSASLKIEMTLTNISWNLSVIRVLDNFGASVLCSKFVFADDGTTHPNYELRVLTVNDLISRTATSSELLRSFEACRKKPSEGILYKKE